MKVTSLLLCGAAVAFAVAIGAGWSLYWVIKGDKARKNRLSDDDEGWP